MKSTMTFIACLLILCHINAAADNPADELDGYPRNVLIEEFTGTWCGWCPHGADVLKGITESNQNVVVLAYHIRDDLETESGRSLSDFYKPGYPQAVFDRSPVSNSPKVPISRSGWEAAVSLREAVSSPVSLAGRCSYDAASGVATLRVAYCMAEAVPYPCRLHIVVTEDSLSAPQKVYKRPESILDPCYHMHVVRDVINGPYGEPVSFAHAGANVCFMKEYSFSPENISRPEQCSVVVFVSEGSDTACGPVIQATEVRLISGK